jgi:hypothetical protein
MKDEPGEEQSKRYPNATPDPRFPVPDCVSFAVEEPQVEAQHDENE